MDSIKLFFKKFYSKWPVLVFDAQAIALAWFLAYSLRYNLMSVSDDMKRQPSLLAFLILSVVQLASYYYFKIYRGLWRYSSLSDGIRIVKSVIASVMIVIPLLYLNGLVAQIPRSVLPLYALLLVTVLCGGRYAFRYFWEQRQREHLEGVAERVLIIGAGFAGEHLVRDLKRLQRYHLVGLIDDNLSKKGLEVHAVPVLGSTAELNELVKAHDVSLIFIAIPSARSSTMRKLVAACEEAKVPFRTLPSISMLAAGRVEVNALREVNIDDLLGRDPVQLNWDKIAETIAGKRVLVTGAGGSIGSELCRQIASFNPSSLMLLDNAEYNLYAIEAELSKRFNHIKIQKCLLSVTDSVGINHLFRQFKPDLVFHAAAYKHVPMLEHQVRVAMLNNVIGTQIVAEASVLVHVDKFILISTDKAVNPTNVMGATKRVAELFCQNLNQRSQTEFITVRFGNVLDSAGSVVPLFRKQIQQGGPVTVTHPEITRYFMTIPEASQLILQAMVNGQGGEIFVLDMGEPIKITYLAEQMIRLAGKEPGRDIAISYVGLRPGEKLFEELFHPSELLAQTAHEKLFQARFREMNWLELTQTLSMIDKACQAYQEDELIVLLQSLVPEFKFRLACSV